MPADSCPPALARDGVAVPAPPLSSDARERVAARRGAGLVSLLIISDNPILSTGGCERFLRYLITGLPGTRYTVDVLQLAEPYIEPRRAEEVRPHLRSFAFRPVDAVYAPRGIGAWNELRARVVAGEWDIVQSQHEKSDLINALLPRGPAATRRISNRRDMGFNKSPALRSAFRLVSGRFDRVLAPSRAILDALVVEEGVPAERCLAIPNGVDIDRFRPASASERQALRADAGFPDDALLIACVANLTPVKHHADLLEAFALVRRKCPAAHLLLAGSGPLEADLRARAGTLGIGAAVHFLGSTEEVERTLRMADLAVLASATEGLSNALLEAQASGLAVVATRVGGNPDLVVEGQTGCLVPPRDPPALAAALLRLAGDPALRATFGAAARRRAVERHAPAAMVAAYDALYRELVDGR
ncbi:MAG: glycosyltransferase [Xanthomonadales bacterium]|nr:glycosyltransferase [Xanthomonadales bacterium]